MMKHVVDGVVCCLLFVVGVVAVVVVVVDVFGSCYCGPSMSLIIGRGHCFMDFVGTLLTQLFAVFCMFWCGWLFILMMQFIQ